MDILISRYALQITVSCRKVCLPPPHTHKYRMGGDCDTFIRIRSPHYPISKPHVAMILIRDGYPAVMLVAVAVSPPLRRALS